MFWLIVLPLVTAIVTLAIIFYKSKEEAYGYFGDNLWVVFCTTFVVLMVGWMMNSVISFGYPALSVPDIKNPVYLDSMSENNTYSDKYILASGTTKNTEIYKYWYFEPGTDRVIYDYVSAQKAPIVFDDPERPYFVKIKAVCTQNTFWATSCNTSIPYTMEFHIPRGSKAQEIKLVP